MGVDEYLVEGDALVGKCLEDKVMGRPEGFFGKRFGAQPVLVGDHDKAEVCFFAEEGQVAEHALREPDLLKCVHLLVGRLFDQRSVAVYE